MTDRLAALEPVGQRTGKGHVCRRKRNYANGEDHQRFFQVRPLGFQEQRKCAVL
jgi:hypothetical protein